MSTWNKDNVIITDLGYTLLSKIQIGNSNIILTRIVSGEGRVAENVLHEQTGVTTPNMEALVLDKRDVPFGSVIELQFSNTVEEVFTAFPINQIGIYASHPDTGEVLYMIAQCDEGTTDTLPTTEDTPATFNYSFNIVHGNNATLTVTLSATGILTSFTDLRDLIVTHILPNERINLISGEALGLQLGKTWRYFLDIDNGHLAADHIVTLTGTGSAMIMNRTTAEIFEGYYIVAKLPYDILANATLRTSNGTAKPVVTINGLPVTACAVTGAFLALIFNAELDKWFLIGGGSSGSDAFDDLYNAFLAHINNLSIHTPRIVAPVTIARASWINEFATNNYWRYRISNANITANSTVDIDFNLASRLIADNACVDGNTTEGAGYVDLYAYSQPSADMTADIIIWKVA